MDDTEDTALLTPSDVLRMPLRAFEARFGFRPVDALEKRWFAVTTHRIDAMTRAAIAAGVVEPGDLSIVVMEEA